MRVEMTDINEIVKDVFKENELEFTIDNRVEVLAGLANNVATMENLEPLERIRVALMISVEIVRLRTEKQLFGL